MADLAFTLDLRNAAAHRIDVRLRIDGMDGTPLELAMARWTPGSHVLYEHARHVEALQARSADGRDLAPRKTGTQRWRLAAASGGIEIRYRVYAHAPSVRAADLTDAHALLQGAAVFLWPADRRDLAATVRIVCPDGWTVRTAASAGEAGFVLPDVDALVRSPWLCGVLDPRPFEVLGVAHEWVLEGLGGLPTPERLVPDTAAIVEQAAAVFGGTLPYREYRFLAAFADAPMAGLEHAGGCTLTAPHTVLHSTGSYEAFMGLVAHEHFHAWNGCRMRPAELWKPDYERANPTPLLWLAEGATAYYDDLLCHRAGVLGADRYLQRLSQGITDMFANAGRRVRSLSEASHDAWIKHDHPDEDRHNATQNFYGNGALLWLSADLELRARTSGSASLDVAMRTLFESTFGQGRGYDFDDICRSLSTAAGEDFEPWLRAAAEGPFEPDLPAALGHAGLQLDSRADHAPTLGVSFRGRGTTIGSVRRDAPAARAGISPGDEILAVNDLRVQQSTWGAVLRSASQAGSEIELLVARRGRVLRRRATPNPHTATRYSVVPARDATPSQLELRQHWLGR